MKKLIKLTLTIALIVAATCAFAQQTPEKSGQQRLTKLKEATEITKDQEAKMLVILTEFAAKQMDAKKESDPEKKAEMTKSANQALFKATKQVLDADQLKAWNEAKKADASK